MRAAFGIMVLVLISTKTVLANTVNQTALNALPGCVQSCSTKVLTMYACTPEQPCFCENEVLESAMSACMMDSGCSFDDQLAAMKFQADTCGEPVRNRGPLLSAVTYTLFGVATFFTISRVLSRWPRLGGAGFGWDDYTALVSYVLLTGMTAGDWFEIHYGGGRYIYTLNAHSVSMFLMWFYICNILYSAAIFLTKISLVLLYLRIWAANKSDKPRFRQLCFSALIGLLITMVAFTIVCIAQCSPVSYVWTSISGGTGTCIDRTTWVWALSGVEIGWDLIVILLPISKLLTLKISGQRKIGICLVFLVGLVVTACSFVRLKYIPGLFTHKNFTYFYSYIGLWSSIEVYLSQVCCCMPAMAGFVRRSWNYLHDPHFRRTLNSSAKHPWMRDPRLAVPEPPPSADTFDIEKNSSGGLSSAHKSDESAPSPVISLQPDQESPLTPPPPPKHPSRAFVTTHHHVQGIQGAPEILYHDHLNNVRLEINDPPESPIKAQLRYIDRDQNIHDIELQGEPRPPSRLTMPRSHRSMSPDPLFFAREKPSIDQLSG